MRASNGALYVAPHGSKLVYGIGPAEAPTPERVKAIDHHIATLRRRPPLNMSTVDALLDARQLLTDCPDVSLDYFPRGVR